MRIRPAAHSDATEISALVQALAAKHIAREFSSAGAHNLLDSLSPAAIEGYLSANYSYWVAEEAGRIVGVVAVRDTNHLYHLFVADAFCRLGIARQLWRRALDMCRAAGHLGPLTVNSSRHAVEMYRKFGFEETGPEQTVDGVVFLPMVYHDAAIEASKETGQ